MQLISPSDLTTTSTSKCKKKKMGKRRYKSADVSALCVLRGNVETSVDLYRYYRVFSTILSTFTCSFKVAQNSFLFFREL